ncbi:uncharacterized protein LOC119081257 [Bradysia coprophila]|uniref:uncharacterized protein LOC119081257 n=1 Tax=Bradysia coprophila TaxID=38358 RepID=UPI00187D8F37|nr:uncharacterized protein LOC119081257 [Bradysia coprophila]
MTKRKTQPKNKLEAPVNGKSSKKRKVLSELDVECRTETRAAKRRRLNNAEIDSGPTDSIVSDVKIKQDIDEVDKVVVSADIGMDDVKVNMNTDLVTAAKLNISKSAIDILNMKSLMSSFNGDNPDQFFEHCRQFVNSSTMASAEILTIDQADTPLWFEMRYGRITASRIYQASRCKTKNGSLVDSIMGKRSGWSFAMQRGTNLEDQVFNILKNEMHLQGHKLKQCGLFVDEKLPHFGASPDGIADDFVVEIKCPATAKTYSEYISVETLQRRYLAQIQLQMHITKRKRALLGVADLNFEKNKKVVKVWIDYDENYVKELIDDANAFWIQAVYPLLRRKHFNK